MVWRLVHLFKTTMITINREKGYIVLSRCEYLYRDGKRDEKANRDMGDGDIIIHLPPHMVETTYDHTGRTDGQNAVTIIEEIQRRLSNIPQSGTGEARSL